MRLETSRRRYASNAPKTRGAERIRRRKIQWDSLSFVTPKATADSEIRKWKNRLKMRPQQLSQCRDSLTRVKRILHVEKFPWQVSVVLNNSRLTEAPKGGLNVSVERV